jgi:uncharacterized protein with GYD domain
MLHMIVNTHNPESCAFRGEEEEELLNRASEEFEASLPDSGGALQGSWVNRAAHEIFMLVEAPNSHVIEEALLAAGFVGRTHSRVMPVVALDDAMKTDKNEEEVR